MSTFVATCVIADATSSVLLSQLKTAYAAFNKGKTTGIRAIISEFGSSKIKIGRYVGYSNIAICDDQPEPRQNQQLIELEMVKLELEKQKMEMMAQLEQQKIQLHEKQEQRQREDSALQRELQEKLQEKQLSAEKDLKEKQLSTQLIIEEKRSETQIIMHRETLQEKRERQALAFEHNKELQERKMAHETIENNKNRNLLSAKMYIGAWKAQGVLPVIGSQSNYYIDSEYVPDVVKAVNPAATQSQIKQLNKIVAVSSEQITMSTGETKLGITCDKLSQMCAVAANAPFELSENDRVKVLTEVDGDLTLANLDNDNEEIKSTETLKTEEFSESEGSDIENTLDTIDKFAPSNGVAEAYASCEIAELIGEAAMSAYINIFLNMRTILRSVINKNARRKIIKWMDHVASDLMSGLSSVRTPAEVKRDTLALNQQSKKRSMPPLLSIMKSENAYDAATETFTCYMCNERKHLTAAHRCHIVSKANGGDCSIDNLIAGCAKCNIQSGVVNAIDALVSQ